MKFTKVTKALGSLVLLGVMGILPVVSLTLHSVNANGTTKIADTRDGADPMPPFPHGGPGLA